MKIILPDDHPTLTCSYEVNELLKSYFPDSPLTFFNFEKIHKDGSKSWITNKADLARSFLELKSRKVYSCAKPEYLNKDNYWFLVEHHLKDFPFNFTRSFNVSNGLCFLERHNDHYYMISFGLDNNYNSPVDYYLNNFENLRNFIKFFRETKTQLVGDLEHNKIYLPSEAQDPNKEILILDGVKRTRIPVYYNNFTSYLTLQEFECIKRLPSGKTSKIIAHELGISHRTVEGYFNRAMTRTGCKNKRELISLLTNIDHI